MMKSCIRFLLVIITFGLMSSGAFAIDEASVISSAEKVVNKWENLLLKELNLVRFHQGDQYWYVNHHTIVPRSINYDVKKTDSLISPYVLVIEFQIKKSDNIESPNANGIKKSTNEKGGFNSAESALRNVASVDFTDHETFQRTMKVYYALQKGFWTIKGGNLDFNLFIEKHLEDRENGHLFKDVIVVPSQ